MNVYRIDPLQDSRWKQLLESHAAASVFHTPAWLEALRRTYGYQPIVFTTSAPNDPLTNGIPFCLVQSWLTGTRLVSVPFADHCQPLFNCAEDFREIAEFLPRITKQEHCDYIELRLLSPEAVASRQSPLALSAVFTHHALDLTPDLTALFAASHKSCFQRKVRKAERENLDYEEGSSDSLIRQFYLLLVMTRRRHGVPPQPLAWFRNLRDSFGDAFKIRVLALKGRPVAAIVTLQYRNKLVYKYGGSDAAFHRLGTMPYLFWQTIQRAKSEGVRELDLGRSDIDDVGLIAFKDHMGAASRQLIYCRYPVSAAGARLGGLQRYQKISAYFPNVVLKMAGSFLYRHMG